jgi:integrase
MAHKENAWLRAFQPDKTSIADDLVFPSELETHICPNKSARVFMEPALEQAGLRKFPFQDLRHTFGSLLIQAGVSPACVHKQMGHRSIQITIDVYGHLIPGENVAWIDTLDKTPQKSRPRTHTSRTRRAGNRKREFQRVCKV